MNDGTRRTIDELVTLHEMEPELSEIITEGRGDAGIIVLLLRRNSIDAAVYSISDRLEVPASEVRRRGQNVGNKGRVIAAALSVQEKSSSAAGKVTFVYDIDDDILLGKTLSENTPGLLHTDYRSIEMYGFAENPIDKLLKVTLRAADDLKADDVLSAITAPLVEIAFARLTLSKLTSPVALNDSFEKRCRIRGDAIFFNVETLVADSINDAGGPRTLGVSREEVMTNVRRDREDAHDIDVRLIIRGHDFTHMCCHYLKTRYPALFRDDRGPYKNWEVFEVALMTCLEVADLQKENLFKEILRRHGTSMPAAALI